ncbi:MAG TPA: hypothetical protein VFZ59_25890 [Verrucomicrobiae bacterium]|nr:hypothetical protein [Verrucomicrobiae bacterium]
MKKALITFGIVLGSIALFLVGLSILFGYLFSVPYPPQPTFGFTGNWRYTGVFGYEERPLPPASRIWEEYLAWEPKTEHRQRLFLARLGGLERQSGFTVSTNSGDTPMGAQRYTDIEFTYTDPTNGTYRLHWSLPGEHDPSFLRFTNQFRLYQLELGGSTNDDPPRLFIQSIEGIRPEHYVGN